MNGAKVKRQVERILDESPHRTLSIIVQGKPAGLSEAIARAAEQALERRAITSATDLLPAPVDEHTALRRKPAEQAAEVREMRRVAARGAGVPVVVAIGNEGAQTSGAPGNDFFALAVGAMDVDDRVAAFSAGRTQIVEETDAIDPKYLPLIYSKPDLAAPGVHVYSCLGKKRWEHLNGTSMAAPHVAGAIAVLLSRTAAAKAGATLLSLSGWDRSDAIIQLVTGSVVDRGENGQDHRFGHGQLSALAAYGNAVDRGYLPAG